MPERKNIKIEQFNSQLFDLFNRQWFLLTAGDFASGEYNTMTVSWGFLGYLWQQPAALAVVRPQRYTLEFMERFDSFTLSAFPDSMRQALQLCGSESGRGMNKIAAVHLTPIASQVVEAPGFDEAELIIECRKLYRGEFVPKGFCEKELIKSIYPADDFHKIFIGGIKSISGIDKFSK